MSLPRRLQQELGLGLNGSNGSKRRFVGGGIDRRQERRKADRVEKKSARAMDKSASRPNRTQRPIAAKTGWSEEQEGSDNKKGLETSRKSISVKEDTQTGPRTTQNLDRPLKSTHKRHPMPIETTYLTDDSSLQRSPSPGLVLDRSSKSFRDRAAQDDAEIETLEKKLGLKKKSLSQLFDEDGLGDLLGEADITQESKRREQEGKEWLQRKRRKVEAEDRYEQDSKDHQSDDSDESELEADCLYEGLEVSDPDEDDFNGFASETDKALEQSTVQSRRENPYVAPVSATAKSTTKYIPPSLRNQKGSDTESMQRLHRQLQGQLNKLSEANLLSILAEVEKLYQSNPRQDVTSTLIDLVLSLFCDPAALQHNFVILHASFMAAVYKVVGADFGAQVISQLIRRFESFHEQQGIGNGKQLVNLTSLLAHLYTFHMVSSNLIFDHLRIFLETLSETNAELLLRVVRDTGPQLRHDDPSSLKDIVLLMQNAAAKAEADGTAISVRTKFMIETLTDLKNNKSKTELASAGVASEHIARMRKVLGTLNSRNIRASEPLRFGLSDVKNADTRGKWWLMGASGMEQERIDEPFSANSRSNLTGTVDLSDGEEADLLQLARQNQMNTAVRRGIFVAIMSATDYQDARLRLLKLRLKRSQEQEIPRVLMHCAGAEERYNPYYTLIAKTLCADRRLKMAFQFSLWDFFKRMGERGDDAESDEEDERQELPLNEIVNTARMFGALIADGTMTLAILKTLNLALLKEQARMFFEVLLVVVICKSQNGAKAARDEDRVATIFATCKDTPQVIGGLEHFLKKVVRHTDLASSRAEARLLQWGCGVAADTLKVVSAGPGERI